MIKRFTKLKNKLSALTCLVLLSSAVSIQAGSQYQLQLTGWEKPVRVDWQLLQLTSPRGETEKYSEVNSPDRLGVVINESEQRLADHAVVRRYTISNEQSKQTLMLKLAFALHVPVKDYVWWNGYSNRVQNQFDPEDASLSQWFPLNAAFAENVGIGIGLDPLEVYSRVDTGRAQNGNQLQLEIPIVLDPGESRTVSFVVTSFPIRYGYRDAVQNYYNLFPKAYLPVENVHPSVISTQSTYLFWKPEGYGIQHSEDMIRRFSGGYGGWEWCYAPFIRGGDWAITDEWSEGFNGRSKASLQKRRESVSERMENALALDVAPMYYVNVLWSEKTLIEDHFPEVQYNSRVRRSWGNDSIYGLYPWANRYGELFVKSLQRIAQDYPASKGIAWDSAFGHMRIPETVAGVLQTEYRSFNKGEQFVLSGVGYTPLLDLNRSLKSGEHSRANAVNLKLVSPYFLGARTDSALYEGHPVEDPRRALRFEVMRANLGSQKVLSWHKNLVPEHLRWIDWESLEPQQIRDAMRQLQQEALFLSYFWGAVPSPGMPTLGVPFVFDEVPTLIELAKMGWQPSPAVDGPSNWLLARYGSGAGAVIAVINPDYSAVQDKLFFPTEYWQGSQALLIRRDGQPLTMDVTQAGTSVELQIPARSIVLLEVAGLVKSDYYGRDPDRVQSRQMPDANGGGKVWRFAVETYDIRNWEVNLAHSPTAALSLIKVGRHQQEFQVEKPIRFQLSSHQWPDEVQEMNRRSGSFSLTRYPHVEIAVSADQLRELPWFTANGGGVRLVVGEDVEESSAMEVRQRLRSWLLMYTANVLGEEQTLIDQRSQGALQQVQSSDLSGVEIHVEVSADADLSHGAIGRVTLAENQITLTAQDSEGMRETLRLFLSTMDRAFPYHGKLYSKGEHMEAAGLTNTVLQQELESGYILNPTFLERWQTHFDDFNK